MGFLKHSVCVMVLLLFSSCMTTSRMNKLVMKYYVKQSKTILTPPPSDVLEMDYSKLKNVNGYSKSKYKSFFTVPLLVYTFSKERIQCEINPKLLTWQLNERLRSYLQSSDFVDKMNGRKVVIEWRKLPNVIEHKYVSHFLALPYTYSNVSVTKTDFRSDEGAFACVMKLIDSNGQVIKEKVYEDVLKAVLIETFFEGRRRDFIWNGLDQVSERNTAAFQLMINSILDEI